MKIIFNFHPVDWNTYINAERSHYLKANKIKQQEKQQVDKFGNIRSRINELYRNRL